MKPLAAYIKSLQVGFDPEKQQDVPEILGYILKLLNQVPTVPSNFFTSTLQVTTSCNVCFSDSVKEERHNIIKLQVSESVAGSFLNFLADEPVLGINCTHCGRPQEGTRWAKFTGAPSLLFLQLMRFSFVGGSFTQKNTAEVFCNERITIRLGDEMDLERSRAVYKLTSIISHSGSLNSGHYIIQGVCENSGNKFLCNDTHVSAVKTFDMSNAYLLVYQRISH